MVQNNVCSFYYWIWFLCYIEHSMIHNKNKVTLKNIHYVSVSCIQFNEWDSLQLNLKFSYTAHLTAVQSKWHWRGFLMDTDSLIANRLNERLSVERSLHDINTGVQNQRLVAYPVMKYRWYICYIVCLFI